MFYSSPIIFAAFSSFTRVVLSTFMLLSVETKGLQMSHFYIVASRGYKTRPPGHISRRYPLYTTFQIFTERIGLTIVSIKHIYEQRQNDTGVLLNRIGV
jgi:hypothetical protein